MNIVIYGNEKLLMKQKLMALQKKYQCSQDEMNLTSYDLNETPMSQVLEDALTPPFLSEYKMVVLHNPLFLTTSKQKEVTKEDEKSFMDYIQHENPTTIFVVYTEEKMDERKKIVKTLRKHAEFFEFDQLDNRQIYQATREAIKSRGSQIDDDALDLLLYRMPNDLLEISNEVEKLCLYTHHITKKDVDRLVKAPLEENVFALTNAILSHDMNKTMAIYQDLMITKHEPIALVALIANSLRNIYQVKFLTRKGYNDREIAKMAGLNPRAIYPIRKNGEGFEINELLQKLNDLSELDIKMKTGVIDKQRGLELFLMNMR